MLKEIRKDLILHGIKGGVPLGKALSQLCFQLKGEKISVPKKQL